MNRFHGRDLGEGLRAMRGGLFSNGYEIETARWQGTDKPPIFLELLHADLIAKMSLTRDHASAILRADQPWADVHFEERVGGIALNPPPSHTMWLKDTDKYLSENDEAFSHSYPERMWAPKMDGIRFQTGNLGTAVELLRNDPTTRQCYVPMWFPEDLTAAVKGERVPCSFGWHFLLRGSPDGEGPDELHCSYHMRSCDVVRHLHNDLYFANRLTLWMIEQAGLTAQPGILHFSSSSLHCFANDRYTLERMI